MNNLRLFLVCAFLTGTLVVSCSPKSSSPKAEKAKEEANHKADVDLIAALEKRHGAIQNWRSSLPNRGRLDAPFSYDLSHALSPSNQEPVVLVMELKDVAEKDGVFVVSFTHSFFDDGVFTLVLDLKCEAKDVSELLKEDNRSFIDSYAIVARIANVTRPSFGLRGSGMTEDTSVEVETDNEVFLAKGSCVEIVKLRTAFWVD